MIHVILYEPEIPQNTGNIMRTCMAMNCQLHIIQPMGFSLDEKHLKRAGMDYMKDLNFKIYDNYDDFQVQHPNIKKFFISRYAKASPEEFHFSEIKEDIYLFFGKESTGIPKDILEGNLETCIRLPMVASARSMNLSNCVAIMVYEVSKQLGYPGLIKHETLKGEDYLETNKSE